MGQELKRWENGRLEHVFAESRRYPVTAVMAGEGKKMGSFRMRFTTRSLMLAVMLVGLNLAGALATFSYYPTQQLGLGEKNNLSAPTIGHTDEHGLTYTYRERRSERPGWRMSDPRRGWRMTELRRIPVPPTLLQIWSPIMASFSISLLIVLVPIGRTGLRRRAAATDHDRSGGSEQWSRRLIATRVIAVVLALIVFNVAGAGSGPRPEPSYIPLQYPEFFGGTPRMLVIRMEGTTVERRPLDASDWLGRLASLGLEPGALDDDGYDLEEATIEYRHDTSIVSYGGTPERKLSRPNLISPPSRTFLERWWTLVGTSLVTVVILILFWRGIRHDIGIVPPGYIT